MRIISSVDGGVVRGIGAGGTKGAGVVSIWYSADQLHVVQQAQASMTLPAGPSGQRCAIRIEAAASNLGHA